MNLTLALALLITAPAQVPTLTNAQAESPGVAVPINAPGSSDTSPVQQQRPVSITFDPASGYSAVVHIGPVLADTELEDAATSGLPLRVRVRVELWKDRMFDQLVDTTSWSTVIAHEPIGDQFFVRSLPATRGLRRASSFESARQAVESDYPLDMRPRTTGQYYYTVSLQIETLSISDLEELERWLQGELQPAVSGQRSVPGAVGQGAKRLMLRILDLPERRYDARTGRFRVP